MKTVLISFINNKFIGAQLSVNPDQLILDIQYLVAGQMLKFKLEKDSPTADLFGTMPMYSPLPQNLLAFKQKDIDNLGASVAGHIIKHFNDDIQSLKVDAGLSFNLFDNDQHSLKLSIERLV